ncbi:maleylpyruvate isomerase N-terminal domain-containing protein [Georgenia sp. TF02-10]|uniref:maleylpyruvate isomerase N-terminal domain-containing protein n=1 Tax=Georgenia sp. TF02-10 TaxID=2917725 RepID=UPI001FA774C8|nr:maleylpyruvate isomerase N-terminal domain-containing protein [Georgenia sp. TF02-10]UNX56113.1 maleylpyruvate isomerase N-terminal domain-containing protein [Georgenia sp. TF02-10]
MTAPAGHRARRPEHQAFAAAAAWFAEEAGHAVGRLEEPGLGEWTVRDLVGHTSRALTTVRAYLTTEPGPTELAGPVEYYQRALRASPAQVAQRGREAGAQLGPDLVAPVRTLVTEVTRLVQDAPDDALAATPFGLMRLADYLPTRTFELVVHTCDLAVALGRSPRPPHAAAASALRLAGELAVRGGHADVVLLALTGRRPLPPGFTVLAGGPAVGQEAGGR